MNISKFIATLGPCGYMPLSGTIGSLVALPYIYALSLYPLYMQYMMTIIFIVIAYQAIKGSLSDFTHSDPSEIIIDEFIGMLITLVGGIVTIKSVCIGFILFRALDIIKPFGIKYIEQIPGALGILLDDCAAAVLAHGLLCCIIDCI